MPGKPSPGRSTLGDSFSDRDDLDLDEALLQAAAEKKAVTREKSKLEVEARKILFVHVRLNRVHCRVTYQVLSLALTMHSVRCGGVLNPVCFPAQPPAKTLLPRVLPAQARRLSDPVALAKWLPGQISLEADNIMTTKAYFGDG